MVAMEEMPLRLKEDRESVCAVEPHSVPDVWRSSGLKEPDMPSIKLPGAKDEGTSTGLGGPLMWFLGPNKEHTIYTNENQVHCKIRFFKCNHG